MIRTEKLIEIEVIPFKDFKDRLSIMRNIKDAKVTIEEGYLYVERLVTI